MGLGAVARRAGEDPPLPQPLLTGGIPPRLLGHPGHLTREVLCSRPHKPSYQRCFLGSELWPRTQLSSSALLPALLLL